MTKTIFAIFIPLGGAFAAEVHPFPPSAIERALPIAQEYLTTPSPAHAMEVWNVLQDLHPTGLVYIDRVLSLIAEDDSPWKSYHERRAWLLTQAGLTLAESPIWINFDRSTLKSSIHRSAQRLLLQLRNSRYQRDLLHIFNALMLWDETDLPFVVNKYFKDRTYAPVLIRLFAKGASEMQRRFATRVRVSKKFELVELSLLYQVHLLRDDELPWLFRRLMENAHFGRFGLDPMFDFYEGDVRLVADLRAKVSLHLHQRLRDGDPLIVELYNQLRRNPSREGKTPSPDEAASYQQFLKDLWTGRFVDKCHLFLIEP